MSGTGQSGRSPTRLTPITGTEPIAQDDKGQGFRPTMYFLQLIQRLLSYIGQPTSSNTPGVTLSGQVGTLNSEMGFVLSGLGPADAGINARVAELEARMQRLLQLQQPAVTRSDAVVLLPPSPMPVARSDVVIPPSPAIAPSSPINAPQSPVLVERNPVVPLPPWDILNLHNGGRVLDGYDTPEGNVAGAIGDLYLRLDGGAGTSGYLKSSGAFGSTTGWSAIGSGGGISTIVVGGGLSGGTITTSGTIALGTIAAGDLLGNPGTAAAVPSAVAIGVGLSLSAAGTLSNTGILTLSAGTGISISGGNTIINAGIVSLAAGANIAITGGNTIASSNPGGTVTQITAGTGLTGGTITAAGTIALDPLGNGLVINSGTIDYNQTPTAFSAARTLAIADNGLWLVDSSGGTVDVIVTVPTFTAGTKFTAVLQNNSTTHNVVLRPGAGATIDGAAGDYPLHTFTSSRIGIDSTGTAWIAEPGNIFWQPSAGYVVALGANMVLTNGTLNATGGMLSNVLFDMSEGVPALSSFTQVGTATITQNLGKAITMKATAGTRNLNGITKAAPATPYRLAMLFQLYIPSVSFPAFSFGFSDGTKYSTVSLSGGSGTFQFEHWSTSTSRSTNGATTNQTPVQPGNLTSYAWFAIENDGTVASFEYSPDGANWIVFQKETISGGFLSNYNTAFVGVLPDTTIPAGFFVVASVRVWDVNGLARVVG